MNVNLKNILIGLRFHTLRSERGLSLLEVLLSTVILGVALAGFLMALSTATTTSKLAIDENQLVYLATIEMERLRATNFEDIPFIQTSDPGELIEVPDYFRDLAVSQAVGGECLIVSSGDLAGATEVYSRDFAFDGKRANVNLRWMGNNNELAYVDTGGGPDVGGGGGGPNVGGPGGDPGVGGDIYAPDDYQYIYCAFPESTRISRLLYDNRFNVTEKMGAPVGDFDYLPHEDDIWQSKFEFFYSDSVLGYGEIFDPWNAPVTSLEKINELGYGSSGIHLIYDNSVEPLEAGIIGVQGIDTYTDFDINFHWPYVSEIEAYGFNFATNYVEEYSYTDTVSGDTIIEYDNLIMYFPNYLDSGFDMGRRVFVRNFTSSSNIFERKDLINVEIEFYPSSLSNNDRVWQQTTWWQSDTSELAKFQTTFYRDEPTRVDRLPNLNDFPVHQVYDNDEDILFPYTVPGASEIRLRFGVIDLGPSPSPDTITVEDADGNIYPFTGEYVSNDWTPWVAGDTIVIHFESSGSGCTYDSGYTGFEIVAAEVKYVGVDSLNP